MSDELKPQGHQYNFLPDEFQKKSLSDKSRKTGFESEGMRDLQQSMALSRREGRPVEDPTKEYVFLKNNLAYSVHIESEGLIVPGQLSVDRKGPFERVSQDQIDQSFVLQDLLAPEVGKPEGVEPRMSILSEEEYREQYREYQTKREARMKKQAQATEYEREDSEYDIKGVNLKIGRG